MKTCMIRRTTAFLSALVCCQMLLSCEGQPENIPDGDPTGTILVPIGGGTPGGDAPDTREPEKTEAATEVIEETIFQDETEAPEPEPLTFQAVTDDYFADALFIGDSCTDGLRMCSQPGDALMYAGTSMTVYGVLDSKLKVDGVTGLRALLEERTFGKIYIMLGINEAGYGMESYLNQYKAMLDEIRTCQPDAIIFIESIIHVTAAFAAEQPVYGKDNLSKRNQALYDMADGENIFFLNINEVLSDGYGNLPASYSDDGVHLKAAYYQNWHDYLLSHGIVK
ncbi:MAG: GDSL-type esterase/lipase family protein [Clostridia bacterium]|nr:GDSL-type esterase/lipase family protein [Clostridia bacterium]